MKIENRISLFPILIASVLLVLSAGCKKDENSIPVLTTSAVSAITLTTATSGGDVTSDGESTVTEKGVCWSTSHDPTISENKTSDGAGTGSFISIMHGLISNTTYYVRAYATNSAGTAYGNEVTFTTLNGAIVFNPNLTYGTVTDIDGNIYKTITIGSKGSKTSQTWMAENLKVKHYQNGDDIPYVTDGTVWSELTTGAYCDYGYTAANSTTFGQMYNLFSVIDSRNIAPAGWHVPSAAEWTTMIDYLGGLSVAGGKLKETGTNHWTSPNTGATNSSGMTVLPGGGGYDSGTFGELYNMALFWTTTTVAGDSSEPETHGYYFDYSYNTESIHAGTYGRGMCGLSVRCIKD